MTSPIQQMIDNACKCLRCGASFGECDCWSPDGPGTKEAQAERTEAEKAFANLCLKAAEECERIAEQTGSTPEKVAGELSEAVQLLQFINDRSHKPSLRAFVGDDWVNDLEDLIARLKDRAIKEDGNG